ncbi:MAG: Protein TolB [bacterium]|nr:Protein TolB [bacterium]
MQTSIFQRRFFFVLAILSCMHPAAAQYFGQNKVQYENFKFKILKTDHFDIYFYPEEEGAAQQAARMAERWYTRHKFILQHELNGRQPILLYASHPQFEQTNSLGSGDIGEGTGGVTEALQRRIVLPLAGPLAETDHVIGHELVHAFQYDITGVNTGGRFRSPAGLQLPLWFIEGMAEFLSLGPNDPNTAMWMRDAVKSEKKLPSLRQLENPRYFPYRYGQALLAYIAGRWGDDKIGDLLKQAGKAGNLDHAIRQVLHVGPDTLTNDWHKALHEAYDPLLKSTETPVKYGKLVINKKAGAGDINVGPVLSPDGKHVIFFSEKGLFAVDLFLADAETGKIERNIIRTEKNPHLESLEFIASAGAWNAAGDRIAFALVTKGRPGIGLLDVKKDKIVREIRLPHLGEVFNPTWSPDGQRIAFSALANGMSDIFIYNLEADSLQRVTNDFYSDLHPAWSPDGKQIAFASDRFTTDLGVLQAGNYRLALYDVATGKISQVPGFQEGKHINPQWSPDGKSVYFISDRDGISNIYRLELASGSLFQVTNLYTGVSGITPSSPAFSVAQKTNRLSFSVFEDGKYNIYTVDAPEALAGKTVAEFADGVNSAELPPMARVSMQLDSVLHNPTMGLANADKERVVDYKSKMALAYIGQPTLAAGYDSYGAFLGGGISFLWSDMLGNHTLGLVTQAQIDGAFRDFAGQLGYTNTSHRLNWGAVVQQIPYIVSQAGEFIAQNNSGDVVDVQQELRYRQLNQEISGFLAYPFSRTQRVEFSAGVQRISFTQQLRTQGFSLYSGQKVIDNTQKLPAPAPLYLADTDLALVYDSSVFGATSPLIGQSYRLDFSPTLGTLDMNTLLVDYRRYFMPIKPFTFAGRLLHFGRYGKDAEDNRLSPLFLGYPGLVRGYDSNSFGTNEFIATSDSTFDSPVFDRLIGSRLAITNFEVRFPFFGLLHLGSGFYGAFPLETGVFYDAGWAWTRNDKASFLGGNRQAVRSYGATARVNLLGYAVLEVDYVNPVDRPQKGWFWQFNFTAGF